MENNQQPQFDTDKLRTQMQSAWQIMLWITALNYKGEMLTPEEEKACIEMDVVSIKQIGREFFKVPSSLPICDEGHSHADGLTISFYYGMPTFVGTPLGGWSFANSRPVFNDQYEGLAAEVVERFGLVQVFQVTHSDMGPHGPLYVVTKDLVGNPWPMLDEGAVFQSPGTCVGVKPAQRLTRDQTKQLFEEVKPKGFKAWNEGHDDGYGLY